MAVEIVRRFVGGAYKYVSQEPTPGGGGGVAVIRQSLSPTMPHLQVEAFAITAVDLEAQTLDFDGPQSLFPVGATFQIVGSSENDGYFVVGTSVATGESSTRVTVTDGELGDSTADGNVESWGTAGVFLRDIEIGDTIVMASSFVSVKEAWDGTQPFAALRSPNLLPLPAFADLTQVDTPYTTDDFVSSTQSWGSSPEFLLAVAAGPLMVYVHANTQSRGAPGATVGEAELTLVIYPAGG